MSEQVVDAAVRAVVIEMLLGRREALCRELASIERQLDKMGAPVKRPKIIIKKPIAST